MLGIRALCVYGVLTFGFIQINLVNRSLNRIFVHDMKQNNVQKERKYKVIPVLPIMFLLTYLWAAWYYGDVLRMARERSFWVASTEQMEFLLSQEYGGLWYLGRMMLSLFRFPWLGALPFALMNGIMMHNRFFMLALFILLWVNDSGAYIVGSLMSKRKEGNHKMFPRVSPAKSWEGLIGGLLFDILAGYIVFKLGWTAEMGLMNSMLFALMMGIVGTLGDLMESLFKRTLGVKDSGKLMPGHGGALDRFDSLMLATPVAYFVFIYLPSLL